MIHFNSKYDLFINMPGSFIQVPASLATPVSSHTTPAAAHLMLHNTVHLPSAFQCILYLGHSVGRLNVRPITLMRAYPIWLSPQSATCSHYKLLVSLISDGCVTGLGLACVPVMMREIVWLETCMLTDGRLVECLASLGQS
jgi:hypothetical protein